MRAAGLLALLALAACDVPGPPTPQEIRTDALALFKSKTVIKDPDSNLCLVILDGYLARRPTFQTYVIRCKSLAHVTEPGGE